MHIAAVSTLFFAALAAAESHGHARRFHHRRALNETITSAATTTTAQAPLTTLTVQTTVLSTIYNCGKNITLTTCDGAHATDAVTVTQIIDLTTTVCPISDASSISQSVIASATLPAPTPANPTGSVPIQSEEEVSPQPSSSGGQVLTYTLGPEGSQTVVTTTIKQTKTASEYTTKFITYDNQPGQTATLVGVVPAESTTTVSSTITSTRFVTVPAGPEATPGAGTDTNIKTPSEGSEGSEGDCPAPVTVTVAATTVYVTVAAPAATPSPETNENNGSTGGDETVDESSPDATTTPCPTSSGAAPAATSVASSAPAVVDEEDIPQSTIYVIPTQKYSNNTLPASTMGAPAPSGFLTKSRPEGTGSKIAPAPTGGYF